MEGSLMDLKILLPYRVFAQVKNVRAVTSGHQCRLVWFFTAKVRLRCSIGSGYFFLRNG